LLADELAKLKSMVTVNTSAVAQAVVGGKLLRHDLSMATANQRETTVYLENLKHLLAGLGQRFPDGDVSWNCPSGGFFAVVTLPFAADDKLLERSAREYRVLWTPMAHFYAGGEGLRQVRLAYSQLTPELIETGLDRFAAFVADQARDVAGGGKLARPAAKGRTMNSFRRWPPAQVVPPAAQGAPRPRAHRPPRRRIRAPFRPPHDRPGR
jgi:(S)-3,5-dihydroxyphenylglycine transaminase